MFFKVRLSWTLAGIAFGFLFPICGLTCDWVFFNKSASSLFELIAENPIHLIVMMAPFVLGTCFAFIGRLYSRQLYHLLKIRFSERTQFRLANTDCLTGSGNRHKFMNDIRLVLADFYSAIVPPQILLIDLDKFKSVNDSLGHNVGDQLLVDVARRIESIASSHFLTFYRLGGDEFVVLFMTAPDNATVDEHADKIVAEMKKPFHIGGTRVSIGASIGISTLVPEDRIPEQILSRADLALYAAKHQGGNGWRRFDPVMAIRAQKTMQVEQDLRLALERDEFFLEYQPIFSTNGQSILGAEALVRWNHPTRGCIPPVAFIDIAEASGLIVPLGEMVLRQACQAALSWPETVHLSVNVSVGQFRNPDFYNQVVSCLADTGLPPERLILEITESLLIDDMDLIAQCFDRLRELGISFALDDFGTGYSSLNHLRNLHLDYLKLDKSFLDNLTQDSREMALIDSVLNLGQALNLVTIMEGVELSEHLEMMRAHGVQQVQGFHLARPMDIASLNRLFAQSKPAAAATG